MSCNFKNIYQRLAIQHVQNVLVPVFQVVLIVFPDFTYLTPLVLVNVQQGITPKFQI
jgi:hypothetical protein